MKNYWFSSDFHFYHKNILKFTKRPFDTIEEMNENFIEWNNENVKDEDEVWNLGDFCFGSINQCKHILKRMKGHQNLILGNHDRNIFTHRHELLKEGLFESIQYYKHLNIDKQKIILFHYPIREWDTKHYGSWHLFGHSHGNTEPYGLSVDVGIDSEWIHKRYVGHPYNLDEISEWMKEGM